VPIAAYGGVVIIDRSRCTAVHAPGGRVAIIAGAARRGPNSLVHAPAERPTAQCG
jgi:hypothetical protein